MPMTDLETGRPAGAGRSAGTGVTSSAFARSRWPPSGCPIPLAGSVAKKIATKKLKPSVIWLHFQECTGCTESLLRTSHPAVSELILDLVSLDYCETPDGRRRAPGRGRPEEGDAGRTPASTCASSKARSPRRTTGSTARSAAERRSRSSTRSRTRRARSSRSVPALRGEASLRRPQPHRRHRSADGSEGQDRRHHPRMPRQSLQLPGHSSPVRHLRNAAGARREEPPEVRVRPHDSRALPAAGALRCRPLRPAVRRRGHRHGLVPLQDRVQGSRDARQLFAFSTSAR